jgi:ABC-type transport system involved in multi-copper enzyme maturation permease subunit
MFKQLLWKEWRENLWKLTFGGAVSAAFVLLLFRIRLFPDAANCVAISSVQMLALPVIYALDIFSGEMSNRTIHLLFKFPVSRWKIFFSKYIISIGGIIAVFLISGLLMELIAQGRETDTGFLLKLNASFGISALLLFTWFCPFGAQSRSEAGSLVAMFGVVIGWGIIMLWSNVMQYEWVMHFVPYQYFVMHLPEESGYIINMPQLILSTSIAALGILAIACYRFVKVRRVL